MSGEGPDVGHISDDDGDSMTIHRETRTGLPVTRAFAARFPQYCVAERVHPVRALIAAVATLLPRA